MCYLPIMLTCLSIAANPQAVDMTLAQLVDAHEKALANIQTADVTFDWLVQSTTHPDFQQQQKIRWSFDRSRDIEWDRTWLLYDKQSKLDDRERFKKDKARVSPLHEDLRIGTKLYRASNGSPFEPSPQNMEYHFGWFTKLNMCHLFQDDEREPLRNLKELVHDASSSKLIGQTKLDGRDVWHIHISYAAEKTVAKMPIDFDLFLDPAANFMVCNVISCQRRDKDPDVKKIERRFVVAEFDNYGNGVYLPAKVNYNVFEDDKKTPGYITVCLVAAVVNAPLPKDALHFKPVIAGPQTK